MSTLLRFMPALEARATMAALSASSSIGVNLLKRGSITYGAMYVIKMEKRRKKHQTQNHQNPGLVSTSMSPPKAAAVRSSEGEQDPFKEIEEPDRGTSWC